MSIPLDRLYHYIESIAREIREDNVIIYRFYPHGSKKIEDLTRLSDCEWTSLVTSPDIYCNDQEPLNFDYYEQNRRTIAKDVIRENVNLRFPMNYYDHTILLHSEKRSSDIEKYKDLKFVPVYYWSHALISRDWFRYAKHITQKKNIKQTFLVYNRAWSGTREYRLGFADRLIMSGLVDHTLMRVSPVDSTIDKHYDLHKFEHTHWRPHNVIEKHFPLCEAESHYSADFNQEDYENTDIEVVLETLFDDLRLHLTEKTLRPIAVGQPFILAGTYGSLKYLRDYGFKTFGDCWDESYDMMSDSLERMNKIIEIMGEIATMPPDKQAEMLLQARAIAEYNRQHFFSNEFQNYILTELKQNLKQALDTVESNNTCQSWFDRRKKYSKNSNWYKILTGQIDHPYQKNRPTIWSSHTRDNIVKVIKQARQYKLRTLSND
jgi:hypothetical protein